MRLHKSICPLITPWPTKLLTNKASTLSRNFLPSELCTSQIWNSNRRYTLYSHIARVGSTRSRSSQEEGIETRWKHFFWSLNGARRASAELPLFGIAVGGGTTGWLRATVGCGLSSRAHYASSTSIVRSRAPVTVHDRAGARPDREIPGSDSFLSNLFSCFCRVVNFWKANIPLPENLFLIFFYPFCFFELFFDVTLMKRFVSAFLFDSQW